jgi:hypothetical protein
MHDVVRVATGVFLTVGVALHVVWLSANVTKRKFRRISKRLEGFKLRHTERVAEMALIGNPR